jgi:hypothetical protein
MSEEIVIATPASGVALSGREKKILEANYLVARKFNSTVEELKACVCPFYQNGGNPDCKGCEQLEPTVRSCAAEYSELILQRPMMVWDKSFTEITQPKPEDMIQLNMVPGIGMRCDDCYMSDKCPLKMPASACRIDWSVPEDALGSPKAMLKELIRLQMKRVARASTFEDIDGGVPDQNTSAEMDRLAELIGQLNDTDAVVFKKTEEVKIPKGNTSILAQIFGPKQPQQGSIEEKTTATVEGEVHVMQEGTSPIPQPKETVKVYTPVKKTGRKHG